MGIQFYARDNNTLERHSNGKCYPRRVECTLSVDWNIGNAEALCKLLRLKMWECPQFGITITEIQDRINSAFSRLPEESDDLVRPEVKKYGKPEVRKDGVVELKPLRYWSFPLYEDGIRIRLEILRDFVAEAKTEGATHIIWG